ncbi:MAG: hypothetical protein AAB887_00520 [Patescibacteria group bacterium]
MKWFLTSIVLSLSLVAIWMGPKKMLAHAEEGLPFYNPSRTFQIYKYIWQDSNLGFINPFLTSRLTLYGFSAWLNSFEIPSQELFFFILILTPLVVIPPLSQTLFPTLNGSVGKFAALFYVFNLFVLTQVWHRFIYPLIFLWSYLPLFLLLWLKWLETREKKYLFYFILSNFIFSDVYGLTSSIFALWIPAGILWFKNRRIIPAVVAIFLWLVTTVWWWYPLVAIKDNRFNKFLNPAQNLISLVDVSKYYLNSDILLLKQKYYFSPQTIWFNFFSRLPINYLSWIFPILLAIGSVWAIKSRSGRLLIIWLVIGWFFIKGANPPWGTQFYEWLFKTFPFTMVVRNPYEKLGVIFLLPYCLLMAFGLSRIPLRFGKILVIFLVGFVLLRPMWTGQVFSGYQVQVPSSYSLANSYLNSGSNLRLLQLPFLHGAGTQYTWGYGGEEPSNFFFDRPSLSGTYFSPTDPYLFLYKYMRSPKTYRLLQLLAVDTIVLHKDTLPGPAYQENYAGSRALLSQMEHISLAKTFPDLDIYQLNPNLPIGWGYLSNRTFSIPSLSDGFDLVVNNDLFKLHSDSFVLSPQNPKNLGDSLPNYTITKLSPIRYLYRIKQATSPYILILSQNFNLGWTAAIDKKELENHFPINGYANGWLVDKPDDYVIDVSFKAWPWD